MNYEQIVEYISKNITCNKYVIDGLKVELTDPVFINIQSDIPFNISKIYFKQRIRLTIEKCEFKNLNFLPNDLSGCHHFVITDCKNLNDISYLNKISGITRLYLFNLPNVKSYNITSVSEKISIFNSNIENLNGIQNCETIDVHGCETFNRIGKTDNILNKLLINDTSITNFKGYPIKPQIERNFNFSDVSRNKKLNTLKGLTWLFDDIVELYDVYQYYPNLSWRDLILPAIDDSIIDVWGECFIDSEYDIDGSGDVDIYFNLDIIVAYIKVLQSIDTKNNIKFLKSALSNKSVFHKMILEDISESQ